MSRQRSITELQPPDDRQVGVQQKHSVPLVLVGGFNSSDRLEHWQLKPGALDSIFGDRLQAFSFLYLSHNIVHFPAEVRHLSMLATHPHFEAGLPVANQHGLVLMAVFPCKAMVILTTYQHKRLHKIAIFIVDSQVPGQVSRHVAVTPFRPVLAGKVHHLLRKLRHFAVARLRHRLLQSSQHITKLSSTRSSSRQVTLPSQN